MIRNAMRIILFGLILFLFLGCDFLLDSYHQPSNEPELTGGAYITNIRITDSGNKQAASRSVTNIKNNQVNEEIELWLMPTVRGNNEPIAHWNAFRIKKFSVLDDGSYEIPLVEFPDSTSVVFIVDAENPDNFDVLGFLTLKIDEENSIIEFPPRSEITGAVEFGEVEIADLSTYLSNSEKTLEDNEASFSENSLEQLQQDVIFQNASLMSVNVLNNTDLNEIEDYYAVSIRIEYFTELDKEIHNSSDVIWGSLEIDIYSSNNSAKASIFTPDGENLNGDEVFVEAIGPQSAVQWFVRIPLDKFTEQAEPRKLWELRDEYGQVLAAFDLSVAMLTDNSNYPIIPLVSPTYEEIGTDIELLNYNWFYFLPDGTTRIELESQSVLERIIGKKEFFLQMDSNSNEEITATYMYRDHGEGGAGGMNGNIATSYDFIPELPVERFNKNMSMGYRFTLFRCSTSWSEQ